jgi:hypothetical protein
VSAHPCPLNRASGERFSSKASGSDSSFAARRRTPRTPSTADGEAGAIADEEKCSQGEAGAIADEEKCSQGEAGAIADEEKCSQEEARVRAESLVQTIATALPVWGEASASPNVGASSNRRSMASSS